MKKDLTTGSPIKSIINFAIPILLGNLLQQIYTVTDTAIVGKFIGIEALAGVSSTGSLNFLVIGFVMGTCTGFGVPMAQSVGAGDLVRLKRLFINSIYTGIAMSIILTTVTLIFIDEILVLMNTNTDMFSHSKTYISTIFAGIIGMCLYNLMASVLRSIGDSKTPLYFLLLSSLINIILDLLFILVFRMGVLGTALATVISQTTSGICCIIYIYKKFDILRLTKDELSVDFKEIRTLIVMGFPMGLQFSITAIGSVVLQSAVNSLGTLYAASIAAGTKINAVTMKCIDSLGMSMAMYTGQNLGARKLERIKTGVIQTIFLGAGYSVCCFILMLFAGDFLALIFINAENTEVLKQVHSYLIVNSASYILLVVLHVFRNTIQGAGYSMFAVCAGVMEMFARCFVAFVLVSNFGYNGAIFSNPVAWTAANIFLVPAYFLIMKRVKKKFAEEDALNLHN